MQKKVIQIKKRGAKEPPAQPKRRIVINKPNAAPPPPPKPKRRIVINKPNAAPPPPPKPRKRFVINKPGTADSTEESNELTQTELDENATVEDTVLISEENSDADYEIATIDAIEDMNEFSSDPDSLQGIPPTTEAEKTDLLKYNGIEYDDELYQEEPLKEPRQRQKPTAKTSAARQMRQIPHRRAQPMRPAARRLHIKKSNPMAKIIPAVIVIIVVIIIASAVSKNAIKPRVRQVTEYKERELTPQERSMAAMSDAQFFEEDNPDKIPEIIAAYQKVIDDYPGTRFAKRAKSAIRRYTKSGADDIRKCMTEMSKNGDLLYLDGDIPAVIAFYKNYNGKFAKETEEFRKKKIAELEAEIKKAEK